ncbi:hypothetical protein BT93_B1549 [Corymbia citriodora subsp. variegata]|nr:hypothetical protein BT93_B1549 [Corymbia citriodora subsp. variegata]
MFPPPLAWCTQYGTPIPLQDATSKLPSDRPGSCRGAEGAGRCRDEGRGLVAASVVTAARLN